MDLRIFKNSYVIFILSFVILYIVFYFSHFGYTTQVQDGKVVNKPGWKYPLAFSLLIWVLWNYYLFPPANQAFKPKPFACCPILEEQKINMVNWN